MPKLLVRPEGETGRVIHVTPESAGWSYVGFDLVKLAAGESASGGESGRETCLVVVSGRASVKAGGAALGEIGGRKSPFDGPAPAAYVPAGVAWTVTADEPTELAVCTAPGTGAGTARIIGAEEMGKETRGRGTNVRHVTNILPETDPTAESLLVVEVITPGGHTSSYPPHKHDRDALPAESMLEETYYHRLNPPQGFAFQRVYTDDGAIDEAMVVKDGDTTLVPKGYHPVAAIHGYDLYYLNVMAGPKRIWKFYNAPEHEWLLKA